MVALVVLVWIAAEIASFVFVAHEIGFLLALALVILVSAVGPMIVRRVGFGVLVDAQRRIASGELPTRELLDGLVVLVGGLLICVPGFLGDVLGLSLMIGPLRHLVIRTSGHRVASRVQRIRTDRWQIVDTTVARRSDQDPRPPIGRGPSA